jgi:phosphomannomutase
VSHALDPTILREYDIRGVVGRTLSEADAWAVGRSFASILRRARGTGVRSRVAVGYDGRLSSPALTEALIGGLTQSGADVVEIGLGPSPMLYFAEASEQDIHGGVQVTGSHNPADHNGFKLVQQGHPFFGEAIAGLGRVAGAGEWLEGSGERERRQILPRYVARLLQGLDGLDPRALADLRIGWDAGNGAAGPALAALTAQLPGEHHLLYCEVDGHFPNHHPDPTVDANLAQLRQLVLDKQLHFGVAFDGDGDRIGVVDGLGRVVRGDQLLAILAEDLLRDAPGATIIADVKSSDTVFDRIAALGGKPVMWKTGHSLLKSKMNETGALLAGEMSGHIFFGRDWYGFDDALLAAVRLIAACVRANRSMTAIRSAMPERIDTPDLRFAVPEERKFALIAEIAERLGREGARIDTTDGIRVRTPDGWWLLRASNTQAMLTARAESGDAAGLARLLDAIAEALAVCGVPRPAELDAKGGA